MNRCGPMRILFSNAAEKIGHQAGDRLNKGRITAILYTRNIHYCLTKNSRLRPGEEKES